MPTKEIMMMTLYCDMDGVLVDFGAGALALVNGALENPEAHDGCPKYAALKEKLRKLNREHVTLLDMEKPEYRGLPEDKVIPEARWLMKKLIFEQGPEWWENLPWTPNGRKLWAGLLKHNPTILSAPMAGATGCEEGKRAWIRKNLGEVPVVLEDEKWHYAEGNVLVDDFAFNTIPWAECGGYPVMHEDEHYKETLELVEELLS